MKYMRTSQEITKIIEKNARKRKLLNPFFPFSEVGIESGIRVGKSTSEIFKSMKKAAKQNLLKESYEQKVF